MEVKEWKKEARDVKKAIREAAKSVTATAEVQDAQTELLSIQDIPVWSEKVSLEESILYSTVFVFFTAALISVVGQKIVSSPKKETIEFDVESSEQITVRPKENKKVLKKTLANIMKNNNAKTTLIQ